MLLQVKVAMTAIPVLLVFSIIAAVSAFAFHDNHHRKLLVGSIGLGVSVTMYGSPLIVMVSDSSMSSTEIFSVIITKRVYTIIGVKWELRESKNQNRNREVLFYQTII